MFTLEILKKVRDGTLRVREKRDIEAAAPLLKDYLVHNQVETMGGLLEAQLREASKLGPEHARDVYWDTISDIGSAATRNGGDTAEWILGELAEPRFPPHTEEEIEARSTQNQERQNQPNLPQLIHRHRENSHFDIVHGIMRHALLRLDTQMAMQAAMLIAAQYKDDLYDEISSTTVKRRGTLYGFSGSTFKLEGHHEQKPLTIPYLQKLSSLADKLDAILGIRGTRKEFIKAAFMQALGNDGTEADAAVKAYILKQADRLPAKDRLDIALYYSTIHYDGHTGKSLCGTLDGRFQRSITYTDEIDVFDRFVDTLKRWTAGSKTIDFTKAFFGLKNQYLDHHEWETLRTKGVYDSRGIKHYAPELRWVEVQRRLEMIRSASNMPSMHPFNFDTNEYLQLATIRAVSYGHAEDLRDIFDYYDGLTPEQKTERHFKNGYLHGFPQHDYYGRVSRDPETLRVLTERLPLSLWVTEEPNHKPPLLVQMMVLPDPQGDIDKKHHFAASYVSAGKPMTMREVAASYAVTFPFLERSLPHFSAAQRRKIEQNIISEGYRPPFQESVRGLLLSEDPQAAGYWVKAMYQTQSPEIARNYAKKAAENLCSFTHCTHQMDVVVGFYKAIKECDPEPEAWQDILANLVSNRHEFLKIYVTHKLAPDMLQLDQAEHADANQLIYRFLARVPEVRESLDTLVEETRAELGFPKRYPSWKDPHENTALWNEIMPYLKKYADLEETHNHVDQARRLSHLFDTFRQVDTFLRRHAQPTRQPVHDLCLFELPQAGEWNKQVWGNLVLRYGHPILRLLPHAPGIEAYIRENIEPMNEERRRINRDVFGKTGRAVHDRTLSLETMTPSMIRAIAVRVGYQRGVENPALANFCINLMAGEDAFNETLDLVARFKDAGKRKDRMPNIVVDGATVGLEGYRMERVPHGDPLSLWIGKIVNCCNHLGGDGADMARAQFKDPNNALYIIRDKRDRPIAKLSGWLSERGNVVFNAWERKSEQEDFLLVRFTTAAALKILETSPKIQRVMLGASSLNPRSVPFQIAANPEEAKAGVGHTRDSDKQFILADRRTMDDTYDMLDWEIAADVQRGEFRIKLRWNEVQRLGLD